MLSPGAVTRRVKAIAVSSEAPAQIDSGAPTAAAGVRGRRIYFVDLLRLVASLQMVHGHTLDALMAESLREGTTYDRWSWGRGLVSVAFMVAAGMSFHLSTLARFDAHRANRHVVRRRFRRGAWLVMLGYLLHFPAGLFSGNPEVVSASLHAFQIADVLQCIGICILVLEAATVFAKSPRQVVYVAAALALTCHALGPLGERLDPNGPFRFAINYVTHQGGSLFPLTPWAGHVFAGVVVGEIALPQGTRTDLDLPLPRLVLCSLAVLAVAGIAELVPWTFVTEQTSRNSQPAFTLLKLGVVLGIISLLAVIGRRITRLPRFLQVLAGESLMLYVFHLLVIYGSGIGLYRMVGHTLSFGAAFGVALVMIASTATVGLGWFRLKKWNEARLGY